MAIFIELVFKINQAIYLNTILGNKTACFSVLTKENRTSKNKQQGETGEQSKKEKKKKK